MRQVWTSSGPARRCGLALALMGPIGAASIAGELAAGQPPSGSRAPGGSTVVVPVPPGWAFVPQAQPGGLPFGRGEPPDRSGIDPRSLVPMDPGIDPGILVEMDPNIDPGIFVGGLPPGPAPSIAPEALGRLRPGGPPGLPRRFFPFRPGQPPRVLPPSPGTPPLSPEPPWPIGPRDRGD
jgi:hypothetical protein